MCNTFMFIICFITILCPVIYTTNSGISEGDSELWTVASNNSIPDNVNHFLWQRLFIIPFESKRHIFKIKSNIQTNNEKYIENINLFHCAKHQTTNDHNEWIDRKLFNDEYNETQLCLKLLAVWTQNENRDKTVISLEKPIGIAIEQNDNEKYLLLEINYRNNDLVKGLTDYSGFELYIDRHNREIDASIVAVGSVPDYRLFIPPKLDEWTISGNCYRECLKKQLNSHGINILDVIHHEKSPFLFDLEIEVTKSDRKPKIVFNQKNDFISNDLKIGSNDQIAVNCKFNSLGENQAIMGGINDRKAQCLVWLLYYPKVDNFDACLSGFSLSTIMSLTGIEDLQEKWRTENDFDILVQSSKSNDQQRLEDYLINKTDWDLRKLERYKWMVKFGKQIPQCNWKRNVFDEII